MTATRWDTREHRDTDARRKRPTTGRPYMPWHDATMAVDGAAARALGELSRERWTTAGGDPIEPPTVVCDPWPEGLEPNFHGVDVAIARTRAAHKDLEPIREIEALFLDTIAAARRFVYAENQFFASRVIAEAIMKRLAEPDGPEFVLVNPLTVEGWIEEEVMSPARARLMQMIREADVHGRFRMYNPVTTAGEEIYVHSKITIVDDRMIRVGSANMNNRSMGLDSECDLLIDTALPANSEAGEPIRDRLHDLLAEHLDVDPTKVAERFEKTGSLIATVEALRGEGRSLVPIEPEAPNAVETALAETELLDPESAGSDAEPEARPGLLRGLRARLHLRRHKPGRRAA